MKLHWFLVPGERGRGLMTERPPRLARASARGRLGERDRRFVRVERGDCPRPGAGRGSSRSVDTQPMRITPAHGSVWRSSRRVDARSVAPEKNAAYSPAVLGRPGGGLALFLARRRRARPPFAVARVLVLPAGRSRRRRLLPGGAVRLGGDRFDHLRSGHPPQRLRRSSTRRPRRTRNGLLAGARRRSREHVRTAVRARGLALRSCALLVVSGTSAAAAAAAVRLGRRNQGGSPASRRSRRRSRRARVRLTEPGVRNVAPPDKPSGSRWRARKSARPAQPAGRPRESRVRVLKVAIIDVGFAGLASAQATGDLPASVTTQDDGVLRLLARSRSMAWRSCRARAWPPTP